MIKTLSISVLFLLIMIAVSFSQEQVSPSFNSAVSQNALESIDNQQINQDEGYGADDEEYNDAEEGDEEI